MTWSVAQGGGSVTSGGLYTTPSTYGGLAIVQAWRLGRTDECEVEISFTGDVNESGDPDVPDEAANTTTTTSPSCAATILYPLDDSAMPGSFNPPLVQWEGGNGNMHQLTLSSSFNTFHVYTAADQYQPTEEMWNALTYLDPGTEIDITIATGNWTGNSFSGSLCTSGLTTTTEATDFFLNGLVIYWAPPLTKEIDLDATGNSLVSLPGFLCHGCHNVNLNNPSRMSYGPDFPGTTNIIDLASPSTIIATMSADYGALNEDGTRIVAGSLFGGLTLFNAETGASLGGVSTPSGSATHPTWSPDGTTLVYSSCDGGASALGAADCDLYKQTWNGSSFSGETLLAASGPNETYFYSTFSPDSEWIAFNRATPVPTEDGQNWSNSNPTADMMLVHVSGSPVIELGNANGTGDLTNSWPRWAPGAGDFGWLAVASQRSYGHQTDGISQLWVTAIDFNVAATGADPSRPPVWLPGQSTSEGNHTPTWVPRLGN